MSRVPGYNVIIKAFIPAPKGDFKAQAAAATLMNSMTETKTIPPEFLTSAKVIDVKGAYGSMVEPQIDPDGSPDQFEPKVTELPAGKRKSAA